MKSISSKLTEPNAISVNYIDIPSNGPFGQIGLEYFEKLDLIIAIYQWEVYVYQIKDDKLIQNAHTEQFQERIKYNGVIFWFLGQTEQILFNNNYQLYILQPQQKSHQKSITFNKLGFDVNDKYFLSNSQEELYLYRKNNLEQVLRYRPKVNISDIYYYQQIILTKNLLSKVRGIRMFKKQLQNFKMIRRLDTLNKLEQFSSDGRYLLICYEKNKVYYLIDLSSMIKVQTFVAEEHQSFKSSFYIKELGLFLIHSNNINQKQTEESNFIYQNTQVQIVQTEKHIKFIKYSQRYGLQIFY